jgi:hypothetical protein
MNRWIGSALLWLCAPLVGLAAINLPFIVLFLADRDFGPVRAQHVAWAIASAAFVAVWGWLAWRLAQRQTGPARQAHVIVSCVLVVAGGVLAFVGSHAKQDHAAVEQVR